MSRNAKLRRRMRDQKAMQARNKEREERRAAWPETIELGGFHWRVPAFENILFDDYQIRDYPTEVPADYEGRREFQRLFSSLFFNGGKLSSFGRQWKKEYSGHVLKAVFTSGMQSFVLGHNQKEKIMAWFLYLATEPLSQENDNAAE